ncbi:hypothetical protein OG453_02995 [Streptomyces sp. NBC_01381]|uniref:hypothetical protein n=1 Tax=Streptomyces sp. NBC_01381 TaxID=2903845 RepID=UPI002251745A|nr:hypothetical protein [Streptomyces sp. NBC_01381]MCX4665650.1 hypothetical protein [Streptomyces sp. NBC_01381]
MTPGPEPPTSGQPGGPGANQLPPWDEPLFSRTFAGPGRTLAKGEVRDAVADAVTREAEPEPGSAA